MGLLAIVLAVQAAGVEAIPLLAPAAAVKWRHGRAAALSGRPGAPQILIYGRDSRLLRSIDVRTAMPEARRAEIVDFLPDENGVVLALVLAALPLGRDARLFCSFPESGRARCSPLEETRCRLLAQDEPGSLWCFGEGPAGMRLHRLEWPREGPRFWLPADALPAAAVRSGARLWLEAPARGKLWLIAPDAALLAETDLHSGIVQLRRLPWLPLPGGAPSFAGCGGRLLALLPLKRKGGAERLDMLYGLYGLNGGWKRDAPGRQWLRGARLAGCEADAAWIWNRAAQRLERVALAAP